MKIKKCEDQVIPTPPKTEKVYTFDEVKKTEGIFKAIGSSTTRLITITFNSIDYNTLYFDGKDLQPAHASWRSYNFTKTDEEIYMSVK